LKYGGNAKNFSGLSGLAIIVEAMNIYGQNGSSYKPERYTGFGDGKKLHNEDAARRLVLFSAGY